VALNAWDSCRFLTCSVLPVARACECECPFCFSRSSISALPRARRVFDPGALDAHLKWSRSRGARRMVITGGGEPLLLADEVVALVRAGREVFDEVACFTNAARLDATLAKRLRDAGLSYLCWSRHHWDDARNRAVMGDAAPALDDVIARASGLTLRATCVMHRGGVEDLDDVGAYVKALGARGVAQFTFKHTYVAHARSVYRESAHDRWCREHQVDEDPLDGEGEVLSALPWGPKVRLWRGAQVCFYREPSPSWELENKLCRSSNLMADGRVYASLEDAQSLLYRLDGSPRRSLPMM
jgi:pyruvate-formate lyase-activating enzyme